MQLAYRRTETTRTGIDAPPIVFLHAFPVDGRMWRRQIARFGGYVDAVALDLRGWGNSVGVPDGDFSFAQYADDVAETLAALRPAVTRAVFAGCSMGGYTIFELWRRHRALITGMVLVDTRAEPDTDEGRKKRAQQIDRIKAEGSGWVAEEMLKAQLSPKTWERKPDLIEELRAWMQRAEPSVVSRTLAALAARADSRDLLPQIDVPALVVVGEDDKVTPPELSQALANGIRGADLKIIPEAGHLSPEENPQAVTDAIERWYRDKF